ncbi:MAG: helix-turn-helix domain-containing protein [Methylomicrobium sp.]|nr:helix-turn-helix domain-containing protein [Methylomicrobium sp.]
MSLKTQSEVTRLIDYFGSVRFTALELGVSTSAVYEWEHGKGMPPGRAIQIEAITGGEFKAVDLYDIEKANLRSLRALEAAKRGVGIGQPKNIDPVRK